MNEEMNEKMDEMKQQTQGTGSTGANGATEHEDRDLAIAQAFATLMESVVYRVVRPEEVPFWMHEDAERHMLLLSTYLNIPRQPIVWFVPALYDEVPDAFMDHVMEAVICAPALVQNKQAMIWSCPDELTAQGLEPVYFWCQQEALGAAEVVGAQGSILLRADLARSGTKGLNAVLAHEMQHRAHALRCAAAQRPLDAVEEDEQAANWFAAWYARCVTVGRDGFTMLPPDGEGESEAEVDIAELEELSASFVEAMRRVA